jgi:hypothetical protein
MSTMDFTKNHGWTQAPAKGKQLLPLIRHPSCFSYSQYVLDITMHNQTQITKLRQEPSYKQSSSCVFCTECCQFLWIVHSW